MMEINGYVQGTAQTMGLNIAESLSSSDTILASVVERQFPHAASARLRMQGNFNTAAACAIARQQSKPAVSYQDHFNSCAATHVRTLNGETLTASMPVPLLQTPRAHRPAFVLRPSS